MTPGDRPAPDDQAPPGDRTPPGPGPAAGGELAALIKARRYAHAARLYSETTGVNLLDSKLAVEKLARKHGHGPKTGCGHILAGCLLLAAGCVAWAVSP